MAAISGELDAVSTGMLFCSTLVCMLQGLGPYDLAAEWTEAMERWSRASAIGRFTCTAPKSSACAGQPPKNVRRPWRPVRRLQPYLRREFGWPSRRGSVHIRLQLGDLQGAERSHSQPGKPGGIRSGTRPGTTSLGRRCLGSGSHPRSSPRSCHFLPTSGAPPCSVVREIADGNLVGARASSGRGSRQGGGSVSEPGINKPAPQWRSGRVRLAAGDLAATRHGFKTAINLWSLVGTRMRWR